MQTILVANPKGGSGKTTVAMNVAGFRAGKRQRVVLADEDPQQSSTQWLARRPALFPAVKPMPPERRELRELDPQYVVIDSPAGLHGERLRDEVRRADVMLVPITPSVFDMAATARFLAQVAEYKAVKEGELSIAVVANRVDARTHSAAELDAFLQGAPFPVIAYLRDPTRAPCSRRSLSPTPPPGRSESSGTPRASICGRRSGSQAGHFAAV